MDTESLILHVCRKEQCRDVFRSRAVLRACCRFLSGCKVGSP